MLTCKFAIYFDIAGCTTVPSTAEYRLLLLGLQFIALICFYLSISIHILLETQEYGLSAFMGSSVVMVLM